MTSQPARERCPTRIDVPRRVSIVAAVAAWLGCLGAAQAAELVPAARPAASAAVAVPGGGPSSATGGSASAPGEPALAPDRVPSDAPRPLGGAEASRYMRHLARELRVLVRDTPVSVETLREDRLLLRMPASWLFRSDAPTLRADTLVRLDALALALASPDGARTTLAISGHSDSLGSRDFNAAFTLRRAEALRAYLAGKGVAEARMQAVGLGESELLEKKEDTPAARQRNRRVEIEIRPLRPSRRAAS